MAVFRIEKTRDYTVMSNHHLKDRTLTLKSKGLLSMMLSLPDEWNYTTRGLAAICREGVDSICLDSDEAGNDACSRLAELVPEGLTVHRLVPLYKDWNEVLQHRAEIADGKYIREAIYGVKEPTQEETVEIIRMSEVDTQTVEWLWEPYIPFGKVTIVQGNPGEGKTTFALRLAAACTTGGTLPGMKSLSPFQVIYQTAEDGLGDTVKPRLIEAAADLDRVLVIDEAKRELILSDPGGVGRFPLDLEAVGLRSSEEGREPVGANHLPGTAGVRNGSTESGLGGMAHGLPERMDGRILWAAEPEGIPRMTERMDDRALRLKTLGNAVCPPQAYPIFRYIAMIENGTCGDFCPYGKEGDCL